MKKSTNYVLKGLVDMKSLDFSYSINVDKAYIIRIKGNSISEALSLRCATSCEMVGMKYDYFDAFDGTGNEIIPPLNMHPIMKMIKLTDHYMTRSEVACALSHISLWAKCVEEDCPLVILEHDTIMLEKYPVHTLFNSICYLGSSEQYYKQTTNYATPPHGSDGVNYHFICRAHAYAIDPAVAKNMLAYVIKYGVCTSIDRLLRADLFPIHQMGLYAYDQPGISTITNRSEKDDRPGKRNDNLII